MLVARLLHSLRSDDVAVHFAILAASRERLERGGPRRLQHTFPALVFAALGLVDRLVAAGGGGWLVMVGVMGCVQCAGVSCCCGSHQDGPSLPGGHAYHHC